MARDSLRLRLRLGRSDVLGVLVDEQDRLEVRVASSVKRIVCPHCGVRCGRVHDRRVKKMRYRHAWGRPTVVVWVRRRMCCDACGKRYLEEHSEY